VAVLLFSVRECVSSYVHFVCGYALRFVYSVFVCVCVCMCVDTYVCVCVVCVCLCVFVCVCVRGGEHCPPLGQITCDALLHRHAAPPAAVPAVPELPPVHPHHFLQSRYLTCLFVGSCSHCFSCMTWLFHWFWDPKVVLTPPPFTTQYAAPPHHRGRHSLRCKDPHPQPKGAATTQALVEGRGSQTVALRPVSCGQGGANLESACTHEHPNARQVVTAPYESAAAAGTAVSLHHTRPPETPSRNDVVTIVMYRGDPIREQSGNAIEAIRCMSCEAKTQTKMGRPPAWALQEGWPAGAGKVAGARRGGC
jgi:hypothetical protein